MVTVQESQSVNIYEGASDDVTTPPLIFKVPLDSRPSFLLISDVAAPRLSNARAAVIPGLIPERRSGVSDRRRRVSGVSGHAPNHANPAAAVLIWTLLLCILRSNSCDANWLKAARGALASTLASSR